MAAEMGFERRGDSGKADASEGQRLSPVAQASDAWAWTGAVWAVRPSGFVSPNAEQRKANVDITIASIELAYSLGIPTLRVNTGRWGTTKDSMN